MDLIKQRDSNHNGFNHRHCMHLDNQTLLEILSENILDSKIQNIESYRKVENHYGMFHQTQPWRSIVNIDFLLNSRYDDRLIECLREDADYVLRR